VIFYISTLFKNIESVIEQAPNPTAFGVGNDGLGQFSRYAFGG
jgi:hypothetical protein